MHTRRGAIMHLPQGAMPMESIDNVRERIEALAQQMNVMGAHTRSVERRLRWWRGVACCGLLLGLVSLVSPSQAADFACASGDVACLIDAINQANANGEANTITLEAGTYTLTAVDNTTDEANGLPSVSGTITIKGVGVDATILERDASAPFFLRLVHVAAAGNLTLQELTLRGGIAEGGGGLFNRGTLALAHTAIADNDAGHGGGGGLLNAAGGTVTIAHSTFANNSGFVVGGLLNAERGTVVITATTFAHNIADGSGAIRNDGTVVVTASTFIENEAAGSGFGAAIGNFDSGTLVVINTTFAHNILASFLGPNSTAVYNRGTTILTNSTLADNSVTAPAVFSSALFSAMGATTIVQNTLLARNTGGSSLQVCSGPVVSLGHNLIGDPTGCTITLQPSDLTGKPGLAAFTDDGTPGNGHFPLLPTSQAIDAGNEAACPRTDQLGAPRVGPCDIGAIEFQGKHQKRH
jgi:hypothetical protein